MAIVSGTDGANYAVIPVQTWIMRDGMLEGCRLVARVIDHPAAPGEFVVLRILGDDPTTTVERWKLGPLDRVDEATAECVCAHALRQVGSVDPACV